MKWTAVHEASGSRVLLVIGFAALALGVGMLMNPGVGFLVLGLSFTAWGLAESPMHLPARKHKELEQYAGFDDIRTMEEAPRYGE
jgi:hypothetical protein